MNPMIVCLCHRVSDREIQQAAAGGCRSLDQLQDELRVGTACGACTDCAHDTLRAAQAALARPAKATVMAPMLGGAARAWQTA
jgi:bacterioferritin-associated ferredoxin